MAQIFYRPDAHLVNKPSVKALNGTHSTDPVALSFPDPMPDDHTSGKGHCIIYAALQHQQLGLCNHKIYTTINFTDEFRNVSVTLRCPRQKWAWLAGRGRCTENRPEWLAGRGHCMESRPELEMVNK